MHIAIDKRTNKRSCGKDISSRQGINEAYMEQLMISLKNASLVKTIRGRNGGYQLAKDAHLISLLEVVEAFEGPIDLTESSGTVPEQVAANGIWLRLGEHIKKQVRAVNLDQIVDEGLQQSADYII